MEYIELDEEMEMPCPCQHCGEWFDLHDGSGSQKWHEGTVICKMCHREEEKEIERDEEVEELQNEISDAEHTLAHARKRLKELGVEPTPYGQSNALGQE